MDSARNLVLTGFMGTGKSTVGRLLAARLGRGFVDVDEAIAEWAGRTISEIFAERGETAFRELEARACREAASRRGVVIATGGGALLDGDVRKAFEETGAVVCLTADAEEIVRRLGAVTDRPLLDCGSADRAGRIDDLMRQRAQIYEGLPHHIDTTGKTPDGVVQAILHWIDEVVLPVRHDRGSYDVRIGLGGLERLGDALRASGIERTARIAVVSNPVVAALYADPTLRSVRRAGYRAGLCLIPDGEACKRLTTAEALYHDLLDLDLDRSGVIVGLGGGVTTDIAGFAAATYMRGIRVVHVPTTLLAMVDAAVGAKTGVDLSRGKNLVGAFWQPASVVVDPAVLRSLPEEELRCGLAETIKHGVVGDPQLFDALFDGPAEVAGWWSNAAVERLARAVRVKIDLIESDPVERGRRATLNLGHTVGHALEATTGYAIRHGEAVSVGMVAAARIAAALDLAPPSLCSRIESMLMRWGLPTRCPQARVDHLLDAMRHDKKRTAAGLRWVLPRAIGQTTIVEGVPVAVVRRILEDLGARSST